MKLVKFGPHQAVLMDNGAQVLFSREKPIVVRTKGPTGLWYRRVDVTPLESQYIDSYLQKAGCESSKIQLYAARHFLDVVESV